MSDGQPEAPAHRVPGTALRRSNASVPTRKQDTLPSLFPWNCLGIACLCNNGIRNFMAYWGRLKEGWFLKSMQLGTLYKISQRSWYRDEPGPRETGSHSFVRILGISSVPQSPSLNLFSLLFFFSQQPGANYPPPCLFFYRDRDGSCGQNLDAQDNSIPSASVLTFFFVPPRQLGL